jgi:hypothetical protein
MKIKAANVIKTRVTKGGKTVQLGKDDAQILFYLQDNPNYQEYVAKKELIKAKYPPLDDMTTKQRRNYYGDVLELVYTDPSLRAAFKDAATDTTFSVYYGFVESVPKNISKKSYLYEYKNKKEELRH